MGIALSMFLTLLVHLVNPGHQAANTQTTVQADVTVAPTDEPMVTITPTDTVTPTVTPTVTVTPTATPSTTPTVTTTPTQTGDGDKDDMFGLKADVHALFGLMNAATHHEQNEQRFEEKHGVKPTGEANEK